MDEFEKAEALIESLADQPRETWRELSLARLARAPRGLVNALAAAYLIDQAASRVRLQVATVEKDAEIPPALGENTGPVPRSNRSAYRKWITQTQEGAAYERKRVAEEEDYQRSRVVMLQGLVSEYVDKLRITWTAELLDSPIALGDGTTVLWGDATTDQHQARYDMHARNALAGAEGAARHLKAIEDITGAGVGNLRELVRRAA